MEGMQGQLLLHARQEKVHWQIFQGGSLGH
jgi:hypothetical protein